MGKEFYNLKSASRQTRTNIFYTNINISISRKFSNILLVLVFQSCVKISHVASTSSHSPTQCKRMHIHRLKWVDDRNAHWFVSQSTVVKDSAFEYIITANVTTTGFNPKFLMTQIYG
jgi:hypothetical protein